MDNSILNNIKKLLNISKENVSFDEDIILHINSVFMILNQMNVGPKEGYKIKDSSDKWSSFTSNDITIEAVKTYIYIKVKKIFDPPTSATVMKAMDSTLVELEWRLNNRLESEGE